MAERSAEPLGAALSRALAREAAWLERAPDEPLAAERARRGLAWLSALAAAHGAHDAGAWLEALRERAPVEEAGTCAPAAWRELGAPRCARLATELVALVQAGSGASPEAAFAALADTPAAWADEIGRVRAFVEPPPSPPPAAPDSSAPPSAPAAEPAPPAVLLAVAAFAGESEPLLTLLPGRVEIAGRHAPGALAPGAIAALDRAAREAGAVVDVAPDEDGGLAWRVLLRPEGPPQHVYLARAEDAAEGPWLAVAAHRVLETGIAAGAVVARLTFGHGVRRAALGPAAPAGALPAGLAVTGEAPGPGGAPVPAVEVVDDAATAAWWPAPTVGAGPPAPPAGAAPAAAPAGALQESPVSADTSGEAPRSAAGTGRRALVADDSLMARVFLARLLAQEGLEVEGVEDGAAARQALAAGGFDFAFLDFDMPDGGALEVLSALDPALRPRVCALVKDEDERQRVEALGVGPALLKPFAEDEVRAALAALRHAGGAEKP